MLFHIMEKKYLLGRTNYLLGRNCRQEACEYGIIFLLQRKRYLNTEFRFSRYTQPII